MERTYNVTLIRGSRSPMHKWTHMKRTQRTFLRVPENTLDWVERYAFFGAMRNTSNVGRWAAMFDEHGRLTETGKVYRDC